MIFYFREKCQFQLLFNSGQIKLLRDELLAWLSIWSKVQFAYGAAGATANLSSLACFIRIEMSLTFLVDPVVDGVERTDRLSCFVDRLDRLHRLVDDFTTRLDLDDFRST